AQNIELLWEEPHANRFMRRFGSFCGLIHFDKRGTGLSSRSAGLSSFAGRMIDMVAVMDAEGVESAVIGGFSEGGTMAALFAATHPERTQGLVLMDTTATWLHTEDTPWNPPADFWMSLAEEWASHWGEGWFSVENLMPSMIGDAEYLAWAARYERQSLTPRGVVDLWRMIVEVDIRSMLSSIHVPTLVLHRDGEWGVENARYLADHIEGAQLAVVPGVDHMPWIGDQDSVLDAIEEFVTGRKAAPLPTDRFLATVLFTDIVDSTQSASRVGDAAWHGMLDEHDRISTGSITGHGGRLVKFTGDGVLAVFDSPSGAVHCAIELGRKLAPGGIRIRAGVHTGEVERRGEDIGGIGVNVAARIQAMAGADEVLASRTVKDLSAGSGLTFEDRGAHRFKGVDEPWQVLAVTA
ncbi:MAG: adenylate/guanylate cyclase domain-containing protein, partial [Acidimicrobiales bacterium]